MPASRTLKVVFISIVLACAAAVIVGTLGLVASLPPIQTARTSLAFAEVKGAELALLKVCSDAKVANIREMLANPSALDVGTPKEVLARHSKLAYELLHHGKTAELDLIPAARSRLADSYMDLGRDPWGRDYVFFFLAGKSTSPSPFQSNILSTYASNESTGQGENNDAGRELVWIASSGKDGVLAALQNRSDSRRSGDQFVQDDLCNFGNVTK